jgi:hypothetical protein
MNTTNNTDLKRRKLMATALAAVPALALVATGVVSPARAMEESKPDRRNEQDGASAPVTPFLLAF